MSLSETTAPCGKRAHPKLQVIDLNAAAPPKLQPQRCVHSCLPKPSWRMPQSQCTRLLPQTAIGTRVCAKQTPANCLFNKRQRFFGFALFGFSDFGTKLYSRQLILLSFNTRLGLFQCSARILQLTFGSNCQFAVRPLGGISSHFGKPQSFQGVRAK